LKTVKGEKWFKFDLYSVDLDCCVCFLEDLTGFLKRGGKKSVENGVCFKKRRSLDSDTVAPPADHRVGSLMLAGEDGGWRRYLP
jgi:hypothetical protein